MRTLVRPSARRRIAQGDSGGPLIQKGEDSRGADDVLVGIVSWGLGCADDVFPGGTWSS